MNLFQGSTINLVPDNATLIKQIVTDVYIDWYATFEGDLGWKEEKF
jgi:hypothetical protein